MLSLLFTVGASTSVLAEPGCGDAPALLQSHSSWQAPQALTAFASEAGGTKRQGPTCLITDLDAGECVGPDTCYACNFTAANQDLPTLGTRFPDSRLLCDGDTGTTCSQLSDSLPIIYKESSQVLVCKGSRTCQAPWAVENVGAVCCSSPSDFGQTCDGARFVVNPAEPLCQNDVCCDGSLVCANANIDTAESLACKGFFACSSATVILEKDLYCNETSNVNTDPGDSGHTCSSGQFVFDPLGVPDPKHSVDCLGNDVCSFATLDFTPSINASISMLCDSNASGTDTGGGSTEGACLGTEVILGTDDCLDLFCVQNIDCEGMTVDTSASGSECFFVGDESFPNIPENCRVVNETQCGPVPPDDICCLDDPDCGSCCNAPSSSTGGEASSTTSTTSTTEESSSSSSSSSSSFSSTTASTTSSSSFSSTTTKKKKPYSQYRRHRRYDRRHRRQHRRYERQHRRQPLDLLPAGTPFEGLAANLHADLERATADKAVCQELLSELATSGAIVAAHCRQGLAEEAERILQVQAKELASEGRHPSMASYGHLAKESRLLEAAGVPNKELQGGYKEAKAERKSVSTTSEDLGMDAGGQPDAWVNAVGASSLVKLCQSTTDFTTVQRGIAPKHRAKRKKSPTSPEDIFREMIDVGVAPALACPWCCWGKWWGTESRNMSWLKPGRTCQKPGIHRVSE
eukprot:Skav209656  [mRNA]  locus=scaffold2126:61685:67598:+ [translate_table: standard]